MKMLLAGLAIAAAAIGGGIGYAGMQTSAIPDWYAQAIDPSGEPVSSPSPAGAEINSADSGAESGSDSTVIEASQLNQMVTDAIASQPYTAPILDVAQGINTSIRNGRVESGTVLNLSDLPLASLPAQGQQAVEQLTRTFPFLTNRDVYLGIEGSPQIVDGALSLNDTHIKVGQLKLPIASVANQLGISQADLEAQIGTLLNQQGLNPSDVQVVDGQLVIR